MSKENLDRFIQQISDSEELQARIGDEMDADTFIGLGAEHGCDFTADDLAAGAELSDEELDGVAGGHHWVGHEYFWKIQRARNSFKKSATVGIKKEGGSDLLEKPGRQ